MLSQVLPPLGLEGTLPCGVETHSRVSPARWVLPLALAVLCEHTADSSAPASASSRPVGSGDVVNKSDEVFDLCNLHPTGTSKQVTR